MPELLFELIIHFFALIKWQVGTKKHVQKRLVLGNLGEVYQQFKEMNSNTKIRLSKSAMLRTKKCVVAGASGTYSVGVCTVHNIVQLMMSNTMIETMTAEETVPQKTC